MNLRNALSSKIVGFGILGLNEASKQNLADSNQTSQSGYHHVLKSNDEKKVFENISPHRVKTLATLKPYDQKSGSFLKDSLKNLTAGSSDDKLGIYKQSEYQLNTVKEIESLNIPMHQSLQNLKENSKQKPNDSVLT